METDTFVRRRYQLEAWMMQIIRKALEQRRRPSPSQKK
jgi:hypothetical protein